MTASTRPDMTLEDIIDQVTDAADLAATRADVLQCYMDKLNSQPIGTWEWQVWLIYTHRALKNLEKTRWSLMCWKGQRDCSFKQYMGHYPRRR